MTGTTLNRQTGARLRAGLQALAASATAIAMTLTLGAPPAQAHAELSGSTPRDGSQLKSAPRSVTLSFSEQVTVSPANMQLLNSAASQVSVQVTQKVVAGRTKVTLTPTSTLGSGRYAARYSVTSSDGHVITGAIAFSVKSSTLRAPAQTRQLSNGVSATLSGAKVGARTLTLKTSARSGTVELTHPSLGAPLRWKVAGDGTSAKASGMLPFSGDWTVTARLRTGSYDESVGTATFSVSR